MSDEMLTGLCSGNRGALCLHDLFMSSCKIKTVAGSHGDAVDRLALSGPSVELVMDAQLLDTDDWWPQKATIINAESVIVTVLKSKSGPLDGFLNIIVLNCVVCVRPFTLISLIRGC